MSPSNRGTKDDSSYTLAFLFEGVFVFPLGGDGAVTFLFVASLPFFWLQLQVTFFFLRLKPMVLWWTLEEVVGAFCEK